MTQFFAQFGLILGAMAILTAEARAGLVIAGSFQGWNPPSGIAMNDLGGGVFEASLTGLSGDTNYEFKILDDQDFPPANWGNPEWTASNNWFRSDGSGNASIRLNTNIGATGQNNMNVGITSGSWTPQVVGDFMVEAGGSGNWNPADATFNMSSLGNNEWTYSMTIANPGNYQIKITDGSGWDRQFGSDGFHNNPGTFSFVTTGANEFVLVHFNSLSPSFSIVPEPSSLLTLATVGLVTLSRMRRRKVC